jgi:hypothetical protein
VGNTKNFLPLWSMKKKRCRVRKDSRRVEAKRKITGDGVRDTLFLGRRKRGSQAKPARPSDKDRMRIE